MWSRRIGNIRFRLGGHDIFHFHCFTRAHSVRCLRTAISFELAFRRDLTENVTGLIVADLKNGLVEVRVDLDVETEIRRLSAGLLNTSSARSSTAGSHYVIQVLAKR